jgi:hypothetical protein
VSKAEGRRQNRGESFPREQSGRNLLTAQVASGMKAAGAWFRLLCGTWEPVAPMPREKRKWRPHERESTEAGHRDGVTRRSEEGPVMGLERRGDSVWLYPWVNPRGEEPGGEGKTVAPSGTPAPSGTLATAHSPTSAGPVRALASLAGSGWTRRAG